MSTPQFDQGVNTGYVHTLRFDQGVNTGDAHTPQFDQGVNTGYVHTLQFNQGVNTGGDVCQDIRTSGPTSGAYNNLQSHSGHQDQWTNVRGIQQSTIQFRTSGPVDQRQGHTTIYNPIQDIRTSGPTSGAYNNLQSHSGHQDQWTNVRGIQQSTIPF